MKNGQKNENKRKKYRDCRGLVGKDGKSHTAAGKET